MKRPIESDYTSQVSYTRALEAYCDSLAQEPDELTIAYMSGLYDGKKAEREACAKVCESYLSESPHSWGGTTMAAAIRARSGNT